MFRYNLGSLMFGSFLIALIWMIRIIFEYIDKKMQSSLEGTGMARPARCISNCIRCCLDCFHRVIKYINKNAYCQIVLTGENFCTAAINGFLLILKHAATFAFTGGVGYVFSFLGKCLISILTVLTMFATLDNWPEYRNEVNSPVGPLLVTFALAYVISSLFMSIYTTTGLCLLHCLFADIDISK